MSLSLRERVVAGNKITDAQRLPGINLFYAAAQDSMSFPSNHIITHFSHYILHDSKFTSFNSYIFLTFTCIFTSLPSTAFYLFAVHFLASLFQSFSGTFEPVFSLFSNEVFSVFGRRRTLHSE